MFHHRKFLSPAVFQTYRLTALVLALAFVTSFIYGFKHLLLLHERNWQIEDTVFFTSFEAWDVDHYLSQIQEVYEGNYLLSNAYLAEYKHTERSPWPLFPNLLLAFIGKSLHIKVQYLAVLMDFLLPPLIFFLAYSFLSTFSSARFIAAFGAFLLVVVPHISRVDILMYLGLRLLQEGFTPPLFHEAHCYYCFSRTLNPQLTYNFLLASLLFFSRGLVTSKNRFFGLTVLFGLMTSYSYVYFSTYLYTVLTTSAIGLWLGKERILFRKTVFTLGCILFGSIPFWHPLLHFSSSEMNQMAVMIKERTPLFRSFNINAHLGEQLILTLLVCALIVYWIRKGFLPNIPGIISFALLISGMICLEQHVITGIRVQPWHYNIYVNPQMTILVTTLLAMEILPNISFQRLPVRLILLYGGIGMLGGSVVLNPSFVARFLSSDGVLTPVFSSFLRCIQISGLSTGAALITIYVLLNSQLSRSVHRLGTYILSFMRKIHWNYVTQLLCFLVLLYVAWDVTLGQYACYRKELKPKYGYLQQLAPALKWLNKHTPPESVVLGSPDFRSTNSIIPIYTHNNVYFSLHSRFYTLPPLSEILDRLYNSMLLMGIRTENEFDEYLEDHNWCGEGSFGIYQQKFKANLYTELTTYQVDYLFYGPREQENFKVDPETAYSFLRKVYDDHKVKIYQIMRKDA